MQVSNTVIYDSTWYGFLTAIFEIYEYKFADPIIYKQGEAMSSLFGNNHETTTDITKANRVMVKLKAALTDHAKIYHAFLSEEAGIEQRLCRYIHEVVILKTIKANEVSHPDVLYIDQLVKKVSRERHRVKAFVRFHQTTDDLYYSLVEPDFNVLPLVIKHFRDRYADQRWLIYDLKRKYGIYYDKQTVQEVTISFNETDTGIELHPDEEFYQRLWKQYFNSTFIKARKNTKLHLQHVPKRYWKNLVEKSIDHG